MSQILSGQRNMQLEKAAELSEIMGLDSNEKDYFILLTEYQNAGSDKLKKYFERKISIIKEKLLDVKENVRNEIILDELAQARFYSSWVYSAIRLSTDIADYKTSAKLAQKFKLSLDEVNSILDFLIEHGLCEKYNNHYRMKVQNTHLDAHSPWAYSRQLQWRNKAQQQMEKKKQNDLFYTGPMVLSLKDIHKIRENLVKVIKNCSELARNSDSEELYCLNIDWFRVES